MNAVLNLIRRVSTLYAYFLRRVLRSKQLAIAERVGIDIHGCQHKFDCALSWKSGATEPVSVSTKSLALSGYRFALVGTKSNYARSLRGIGR